MTIDSKFIGLKGLSGPVVITGHTGFKGAWLSLMLRKIGVESIGIALPAEQGSLATQLNSSVLGKEFLLDIRNRQELDSVLKSIKPSFIFHLAAQALVLESYRTPVETFETNVVGTANILDAVTNIPDTLGIVVATTDKVYSNSNLGRRFVETDALMGTDPYSASKVGTEAVISAWQTINQRRANFGITAVRAGNVIGGGDDAANRLLPDLIRGFAGKKAVEIRNPQSTRPWQHVIDPLYGYLLTAESILSGKTTPAFNFGPLEESLSVQEVAELAQSTWGQQTKVEFTESESAPYEAGLLELDATLAEKELGWMPLMSQKDSVISTVSWWKRKLNGEMSAEEACESDLERYEF